MSIVLQKIYLYEMKQIQQKTLEQILIQMKDYKKKSLNVKKQIQQFLFLMKKIIKKISLKMKMRKI